MKKVIILIITIFTILIACKTKQTSSSVSNAIKPKVAIFKDSVFSDVVDTLSNYVIDYNYQSDSTTKSLMSKYLIPEITKPGEQNKIYQEFMNNGSMLAVKALNAFRTSIISGPVDANYRAIIKTLPDTSELKNCKLVQIPIYYLTPNVVNIKKGESIINYFSLDTVTYTYQVLKGNKLVAILTHRNNRSGILFSYDSFIDVYERIIDYQKKAIMFQIVIRIPKFRMSPIYTTLGYLSNDELVFVTRTKGDYIKTSSDDPIGRKQYVDEFLTMSADKYLLTYSSFVKNEIDQFLKNMQQVYVEK